MRKECNIVKDLLPLYAEGLASADSGDLVREHTARCPQCRKELEALEQPMEAAFVPELAPMQHLKKQLKQKKARTMSLTALLVLVVAVAVFGFLTAPQYFPYSPYLLTVTDQGNGQLTLEFSPDVTGYRLRQGSSENGLDTVYELEAWTSLWDQWFQPRGTISGSLQDDSSFALYYAQNQYQDGHHPENVLLYHTPGMTLPGGVITLPRLTLWYWFVLSAVASVVLAVLWGLFRKRETLRRVLGRVLGVPVAYCVAYGLVSGSRSSTWSPQRDFSLMVLLGLLVYGAGWLAMGLYKTRKEGRDL